MTETHAPLDAMPEDYNSGRAQKAVIEAARGDGVLYVDHTKLSEAPAVKSKFPTFPVYLALGIFIAGMIVRIVQEALS